jgi:hypothetical protein
MGDVVNLRTIRRQRRRAEARARGGEAAARSGERPAEAAQREAEAALERRRLDGHRRPARDDDSDDAPS